MSEQDNILMQRLRERVPRYDEIELAFEAAGLNLDWFVQAVVASLFEHQEAEETPITAPYGFVAVKDASGGWKLEEHPAEFAARALILWWRNTKKLGVTEIVRRLEEQGIPSRGKRWHRQSIYRILESEEGEG